MIAACRHRSVWGLACLLGVACLGCGYQEYEKRLNESKLYFAYLEKLNSNLATSWQNGPRTGPGPIEELRVPQQFRELPRPKPPPPKPKDGEAEAAEPEPDPRQPDYVALELPGMLAAWQSPFQVSVEGKSETRKGYLYALSNFELYRHPDNADKATTFTLDLLTLIADKLSLPAKDPARDVERETYPRSKTYTTPNTFDVYRFQSDSLRIDGVRYTFEVYSHAQKDIQVCLLLVLPAGIDPNSKLTERIPLMLETLKVSPKKPSAATPRSGGPAPGPAPGPATGF